MALVDLNFLTTVDLNAQIIDQFLIERDGEDVQLILENIEAQQIALIKTKLKGRYDVEEIFTATGTDRHYLIIKLLTALTIYYFIRRNAARKVPSNFNDDWMWAMKMLESIKAGKETPDGLPVIKDNEGNDKSILMHGNNTNTDFYI